MNGFFAGRTSLLEVGRVVADFVKPEVRLADSGVGPGKLGIQFDGLIEQLEGRTHHVGVRGAVQSFVALQVEDVGAQIIGRLLLQLPPRVDRQRDLQLVGHRGRNFLLDGENVRQRPIVDLSENLVAVGAVDQLRVHADPVLALAGTAFEHVSHGQQSSDFAHVDLDIAELEGRGPCGDVQLLQASKQVQDFFAQAQSEEVGVLLPVEIPERKNRDRVPGRLGQDWGAALQFAVDVGRIGLAGEQHNGAVGHAGHQQDEQSGEPQIRFASWPGRFPFATPEWKVQSQPIVAGPDDPGQQERDRQAGDGRNDQCAHRPGGETHGLEGHFGDLEDDPGRDGIEGDAAKDLAAAQFRCEVLDVT